MEGDLSLSPDQQISRTAVLTNDLSTYPTK